MPAAWLSTVRPAAAARKNTNQSCQKTRVRFCAAAPGSSDAAGRGRRMPDAWTSRLASSPQSSKAAARPASVARTPHSASAQANSGAAIMAPAGKRLTT